mmetsp:Transcript_34292/g.50416  ORF Transcript_34292/g.50416 Transcript_34292/m.50416 type:complete len:256 (-) Transcript_34292:324-1091(-)|eukprot:CAMPEP_0195512272 /NCGR_PEP_ID=MMETSP0794_2-20130614/4284_1 /TAXON_ID=515487 /ORGANISM="Stephanopyxis turris, Strain CCMP 815" /LENGTH=255 /DNA_ID=CAMNT_0040640013 /DNA_START=121 /DNA_END=888 /DNA_ORIENTATION=-
MNISIFIVMFAVAGTNAFVPMPSFARTLSVSKQSSSTVTLSSLSEATPTSADNTTSPIASVDDSKPQMPRSYLISSSPPVWADKTTVSASSYNAYDILEGSRQIINVSADKSVPPTTTTASPSAPSTVKHLDANGIAYLNSLKGNKVASSPPSTQDPEPSGEISDIPSETTVSNERIEELEREVERLRIENEMLKRVTSDLTSNLRELAGLLAEMDDHRMEILESADKFEETLCNAAEVFPDDEELTSYEWLTKR